MAIQMKRTEYKDCLDCRICCSEQKLIAGDKRLYNLNWKKWISYQTKDVDDGVNPRRMQGWKQLEIKQIKSVTVPSCPICRIYFNVFLYILFEKTFESFWKYVNTSMKINLVKLPEAYAWFFSEK